jgi:iron complex outermembrane receptor protein
VAAFTKPANVPYLNLFCDPNAFTCNSAATLAYMASGFRHYVEENNVAEFSGEFDGPVYTLPGGDIKAALGASYYHLAYNFEDKENWNEPALSDIIDLIDHESRNVVAGYGQLNVPIVGENNKLPFVDKLELEGSVRYDSYNTFGSTFNPKVSGTWGIVDGLELKGGWGTSFRAPSFTEESAIAATLIQSVNTFGGAASNTVGTCPAGATAAVAGSPAATLDPSCDSAHQFLGGISLANGAGIAAAVRSSTTLQPERAQNLSTGFEWAPTDSIFKGLDIQATYFFIKIRNKLQACPNAGLDSPLSTFCYIDAANDPNFAAAVQSLITNPKSQLPTNLAASNVSYVFDGAIRNIGWQTLKGVDFSGNYNWDMYDWGTFDAGITGTYIVDNYSQSEPGQPVVSVYSTISSTGTRDSGGRLKYRTHLTWTGGPDDAFGIGAFMTFFPHTNSNGGALPPTCFLAGQPACDASGMPQYAQYTTQYPTLSNYVPGMYIFDLQLSYRTHDVPINPYLKNIAVTFMITDLFNRAPPLVYSLPSGSGIGHSYGGDVSPDQRTFLLTVTKTW